MTQPVNLSCDVLVIGAGPAGCTAAKTAAESGCKVILLEKKSIVGIPVHCAGFVPLILAYEVVIPSKCIAQKINTMKIYLPNGEILLTKSPGYILHRDIFDQQLAEQSVANGVTLLTGTRAIHRQDELVIARNNTDEIKIIATVIIGADGAISTVGRWITQMNTKFIYAIQQELLYDKASDTTEVYFDLQYRGGYAWLFPKGNTVNVGVGISTQDSKKLDYAFTTFLNQLTQQNRIHKNTVINQLRGVIPVTTDAHVLRKENVVLIGDAAGHTDPVTGSGIIPAVISGKIAGRFAALAVKEKDLSILDNYEIEWRALFGEYYTHSYERRKLLDDNWTEESFINTIKKSWSVFFGE